MKNLCAAIPEDLLAGFDDLKGSWLPDLDR
jgi:hypothetical protein